MPRFECRVMVAELILVREQVLTMELLRKSIRVRWNQLGSVCAEVGTDYSWNEKIGCGLDSYKALTMARLIRTKLTIEVLVLILMHI